MGGTRSWLVNDGKQACSAARKIKLPGASKSEATISFLWIMTVTGYPRVWYQNQTTGLRSGTSPRPEDADSCKRPKARGMAKSPAIARRFAVVRWKLGGPVSLL